MGVDVQRLRWGSGSHPGRVRAVNEDALIAGPRVFAVADGMGGHAAGEIASSVIISAVADAADRGTIDERALRAALREGQARMRKTVQRRPESAGMGCTLAGISWCDGPEMDTVLVFHIGDARVYRLGGGRLMACTRDHSVVQERIDAGTLTAEAARRDADRHLVTRAITPESAVEPEIRQEHAHVGDRWLVCSDGLSDAVAAPAIEQLLQAAPDAAAASSALVEAALDAGAPDNVSAIVVEVTGATTGSASPVPGCGLNEDPAVTLPPSQRRSSR